MNVGVGKEGTYSKPMRLVNMTFEKVEGADINNHSAKARKKERYEVLRICDEYKICLTCIWNLIARRNIK
jgi:hypothetical protein